MTHLREIYCKDNQFRNNDAKKRILPNPPSSHPNVTDNVKIIPKTPKIDVFKTNFNINGAKHSPSTPPCRPYLASGGLPAQI